MAWSALALPGCAAGSFRLSGLWLRALLAPALTAPVPGVAAGSAHLLVSLAPVAPLLFDEGPVPLKRGAKLHWRYLGLWIQRTDAVGILRGRGTGKEQRRHCKSNFSHRSLDITGARKCARNGGRWARADSVRGQRARGGRSRPSG